VSSGKHGDILLQSLMFVNLATSLGVNHGHLSLNTTLLGEKLLVLTSFSLGLGYVSTRRGRNVMCKLSQRNDDSQRGEATKKKRTAGISPS